MGSLCSGIYCEGLLEVGWVEEVVEVYVNVVVYFHSDVIWDFFY